VVLDAVTLDTGDVHSLVFIGPSGGGKSTLLRIIGGLEVPDGGTVWVDGVQVSYSEADLIQYRRRLGMVFQAFNLFPHMTALQNITLPLEKVHGYSRSRAEGTGLQLLRRFHLEAHAHKRPAELSGGQRQRVAIARAVSVKPRILLFDEPTSALDPEMTAEVLEVIEELKHEGRDMILVTHEMGFARAAAEQVVFLAEGRVVEHGEGSRIMVTPREPVTREFLSRVMRY